MRGRRLPGSVETSSKLVPSMANPRRSRDYGTPIQEERGDEKRAKRKNPGRCVAGDDAEPGRGESASTGRPQGAVQSCSDIPRGRQEAAADRRGKGASGDRRGRTNQGEECRRRTPDPGERGRGHAEELEIRASQWRNHNAAGV